MANPSLRRWSSSGSDAPACRSHLVSPRATVGPAARVATSSSVTRSTSPEGTAR